MATYLNKHHLVILFFLILLALAARLPNLRSDLADHDSWRQVDTASIAANFLNEPNIFFPKINWGAPGPGYVETEFQLYPYTVHILYRLFGQNPLYGRLLSLFLTGISALVFYKISIRYLQPPSAVSAVLFFLWSPIIFRYSRCFMPEATVLLFYLLALLFFLKFLDKNSWPAVISSALFMTLAILVKPTSIHLGLVFIILSLLHGGRRFLLSKKLIAFAFISLIPAILFYFHAASLHMTYGNTFGVISGGDSKWGDLSWWLDPNFYKNLFQMESYHITGGKIGVIAVLTGAWSIRKTKLFKLCCIWGVVIFIYYLIVARYAGTGRGLQYHIYAAAPISLLLAANIEFVIKNFKQRSTLKKSFLWLIIILLLLTLAQQSRENLTLLRWSYSPDSFSSVLKDAGIALKKISRPDDFIVVVSSDVAIDPDKGVPNNFEQPNVFFYADRKGRSLGKDQLNSIDLQSALSCGAKWFVNFPEISDITSTKDFSGFLNQNMRLIKKGHRYNIYQVNQYLTEKKLPGALKN